MQAARLHLPLVGDLRRPRLDVRLRPLRRAAQDERQERVVARDAAERDDIVALDSAILQHPKVWEASGHLAGFTDPLVDCRTCGQRFRADHLSELPCPRKPSKPPGRGPGLRPDRGARLQPHVRDDGRPGEGLRLGRLPAPGDRAGHLHQLQERPAVRPQEAAVRHRAGRQVVPQRDHARELHLPHARVRADGDGVLRAARPRPALVRLLEAGALRLVRGARAARRPPAPARARRRRAVATTRSGTADVEYLFPIGWSELEGIANRGDFDLTQHARVLAARSSSTSTRRTGERYVPHVIEPAAGADRATLAFLVDAYDEEEVEGEPRTVLKLHPRLAPVKVAVLPLVRKDGQPELAARGLRRAARRRAGRVRRGRVDRQALPPPGRDRHAVVRDDRPPVPRGPHRHPARPRLAGPGARGDRRAPRPARRPASTGPGARRSSPRPRRRSPPPLGGRPRTSR